MTQLAGAGLQATLLHNPQMTTILQQFRQINLSGDIRAPNKLSNEDKLSTALLPESIESKQKETGRHNGGESERSG
jgi:hypothetical protein